MTAIVNATRARMPAATGRYRRQRVMFMALRLAAGINILALLGVCGFLVVNGAPALSWEFLTQAPRNMMTEGGIWPCMVGTVLLALGAMLVAFPLGVGAALWLNEYGSRSPCRAISGWESTTWPECPQWSSACSGYLFSLLFWAWASVCWPGC